MNTIKTTCTKNVAIFTFYINLKIMSTYDLILVCLPYTLNENPVAESLITTHNLKRKKHAEEGTFLKDFQSNSLSYKCIRNTSYTIQTNHFS